MTSRRLCVAGYSGHVILFKFKKQECLSEILVLEIPITYENTDETDVSPECEFIPRSLPKQPDSMENERKVCANKKLIFNAFCVYTHFIIPYLISSSISRSFCVYK